MGRGHPLVKFVERHSLDARVGSTGERGSDIDVHTGGVDGRVQTTPGRHGEQQTWLRCHHWSDNTALNHALA
ncbi:hypothetical protein GCM10009006_13750 [Haloarcula argentinensis]|uniref:Uncharacterized protein n=1 Tax=Haloarcula argentinensis TaxID=43776 RepID=A0A830FU48_HALAR|nr:hypothetical protein GCM10009006_13750 [Haloarcula argentinensis]